MTMARRNEIEPTKSRNVEDFVPLAFASIRELLLAGRQIVTKNQPRSKWRMSASTKLALACFFGSPVDE